MAPTQSPFLQPGPTASADKLSIIHLKRDLQVPVTLKEVDEDDDGYFEGKVLNTRFGSFPHNTLIGLPWGSQVRASIVDTGSRGRRKVQDKRKREESASDVVHKRQKVDDPLPEPSPTPTTSTETKEAIPAQSGFVHIVPPTPENWTSSLPHRTQVVYTPDYSYILHRLRARPGTSIIEAGAGSGSFTHAAARAVYRGYPDEAGNGQAVGRVWSYEFHEPRHAKLVKEIQGHGLDGFVHITHRDVCEKGFLVDDQSPKANAAFLDLPAPWLALPHLSRSSSQILESDDLLFVSPLNSDTSVYICTFSPCIEQVQRTISVMRQLGWVDIETVVVANKRLEVRRERTGIGQGAQRGVQTTASSVDEAVTRLLEVEGMFKDFQDNGGAAHTSIHEKTCSKKSLTANFRESKAYKEGKLVHRLEPEIKTHTSYLVFATLPREWSDADEQRLRQKWPMKLRTADEESSTNVIGMSRRQMKRAARQAQKDGHLKKDRP